MYMPAGFSGMCVRKKTERLCGHEKADYYIGWGDGDQSEIA